jgi:hypothetical protein
MGIIKTMQHGPVSIVHIPAEIVKVFMNVHLVNWDICLFKIIHACMIALLVFTLISLCFYVNHAYFPVIVAHIHQLPVLLVIIKHFFILTIVYLPVLMDMLRLDIN